MTRMVEDRLVVLLRHLFLVAGALFITLPFIWALSISAKPAHELFDVSLRLLPQDWALAENYSRAASRAPILTFLTNGALVCAGIFFFQLCVCVPAAYALAVLRWRGRDFVFALVITGLLLPQQALAIPLFIMFRHLGITDSYTGLILPSVASVFGLFLLRQFIRTVPMELIHAARIDGMSELGIIWRIVVPLCMPAIIAFGIFSLVTNWNDLYWPMIVVRSPEIATPPLGLLMFLSSEDGSDLGALMAFVVMITAPLLIVFLMAQRRFISGIALTGFR